MPANIRVGGVRVDFSANDSRYQAVARSVEASNRRLSNSYRSVGRTASNQNKLVTQFTGSLQSSLIATVAYAAGVRLLTSATTGSIQNFLEWDAGLIRVAKTTNLADAELERLEGRLERLLTVDSRLGRPLSITADNLLEISEASGQIGIRGVNNLARFSQAAAALQISSDLLGEEAARGLGAFLAATDTVPERVDEIASAVTHLGNIVAGGEVEILGFAQRIASEVRGPGGLPNEEIFALAASFVNVKARAESAGTVVGRALDAINQLAGDLDPERFLAVGRAAGVADEKILQLIEDLRSGERGPQAYADALGILVRALSELPAVAGPDSLSRGSLLELIFGNTNQRIRTNLSTLARGLQNFTEFQEEAAEAVRSGDAHYREAARAAEGYGARFDVVGERISAQSRSVGEALTIATLPIAENFEVLELAIVGAGTALATRFGRNRLRAISDAGLRFRRDLQLQEQVARSAVVSAQREVAAVTAANRASLATGFQRITLAENLARAELKAAAATRAHAISVATLSRANRIGARATRAASTALAFVGGPIGLIATALSVGATAWLLWGNRADEATRGDDLEERLRGIVDEAKNLGVTLNQQTIREATDRISRLNEELSELRGPLAPSLQNIRDPLSGGEPGLRAVQIARDRAEERRRRQQIAAREAEVAALLEITDKARAANEELERGADSSDDLDKVASSLQRISLALDDPTRQIRDFINELERATEIATQRARFDLSIAPLPQFEQDVQIAILERREEVQERLLQLEQDLGDQIQDQGRARALLSQTEAIRDQFAIGTKTREEAERQVGQAQRQADEQDRQVDLRRQALEFARSQLRVDQDLLETQIRAQNLARNAQALNQPLSIDPADLRSQARAAEDFTQQIQLRVDSQEREARQLAELTGLRQVDHAALQARFAVLNRFSDAQIRADADIIRAEEQLIESRRELARVTASLGETSSQEDRNLLLSSRQRSADAAVALAEARAYRDELERQGPAALAAADASAEAQARIAQIQIDGASRLRLATNLAVSGVRSTEDAIVELATTGPIAFKEFADAIVADLLRIIVRATFTVNLLRFLGLGAGGEATGGGLLGRLGIGGGARSVSGLFSGPAVLHEGGVAGNLGALGSNEVLTILEKGEEVIPQTDPRHRYNIGDLISRLPRYHDGGVVGGDRHTARPETMRIVIENRSSTPLEAVQTTQRTDVNQHITTIILDDVRKKGPITRGLSQRLGRPF